MSYRTSGAHTGGAFNILQESDIQIRGFKLRFPLDVHFVFTANPKIIPTVVLSSRR